MTSKIPVRVAEDVDEASLSYSEIKALATGNPLIKEKMDLDNEVTKLKMLEANYKSNKYKLEDKVNKIYPQSILKTEMEIQAVKEDIASVEKLGEGDNKFTSISLGANKILDKKEAGEKLLEEIKKVKINDSKVIGKYRNLDLQVSYNFMNNTHTFKLLGKSEYFGELSNSTDGNITRLDNAIEKMPSRLERLNQNLENYKESLENSNELEEKDDLINLVGNIAGKVENLERENANGEKFKVSNFSLVSKDDDGNKVYTNCSAYGDKTKYLESLKQGDFVKIFGQVKTSIDNNGKEHKNVRILSSKLLKAKEQVKPLGEEKKNQEIKGHILEDAKDDKVDFSNVVVEDLFEEDVDFETFSKADYKAVKVISCKEVPKSKKLLEFTLDDGSGVERTILLGIKSYYSPEELIGKTPLSITNLPPRKMMGIDSCGMLLSAIHKENDEERSNLIMLENNIPAGSKIH